MGRPLQGGPSFRELEEFKGEEMRIQAAVVKEQRVTFAIVVVKRHLIQSTFRARTTINQARTLFPDMPIVLMTQDGRGTPTYYGRRDIVKCLSRVPLRAIPWKTYTFS